MRELQFWVKAIAVISTICVAYVVGFANGFGHKPQAAVVETNVTNQMLGGK